MRLLLALLVAAAAAISTVAEGRALTQPKPDFSGTWVCDQQRSTRCTSDTMVVEQSGETLTVSRTGTPPVVTTYRLDGTETTRESGRPIDPTGLQVRPIPVRATARWDGTTLVIRSRTVEGNSLSGRERWQLNTDATELVVEAVWSAPGRPTGRSRRIWTRKSP